jgi:hypothetical protein
MLPTLNIDFLAFFAQIHFVVVNFLKEAKCFLKTEVAAFMTTS